MRVLEQEYRSVGVNEIRPHERNVNAGDVGAIFESIEHNGFFGSVIVQSSTGKILCGTHRWKAAMEAGATEIPATFVDCTDAQAVKIMLADNRTARLGQDDETKLAELLAELQTTVGLEGTGFDADDLDEIIATLAGGHVGAGVYSGKVEAPVYEPTGEKPPVDSLCDDMKARSLIQAIDSSSVPEDVKRFLTVAAWRHTVIDFGKVAEFYAHADSETQALMEDSALVIIDFNRAIELGYVRLSEALADQYRNEYGEDE